MLSFDYLAHTETTDGHTRWLLDGDDKTMLTFTDASN
jgi:hypothetical protein